MLERDFLRIHIYCTMLVTIGIWILLIWGYYHGGIPSHHILARPDLPSISNAWGGLLLPMLTWFLLSRIKNRSLKDKKYINIFYAFIIALLYGILLSTSFTLGYKDLNGYLALGLLALGFFFPIYRSEYLLGFVIGMTYVFGAIIPTIFACIIALISTLSYLLIRPIFLFLFSRIITAFNK